MTDQNVTGRTDISTNLTNTHLTQFFQVHDVVPDASPLEYEGKKCLTLRTVDQIHGHPEAHSQKTFHRHRGRFERRQIR